MPTEESVGAMAWQIDSGGSWKMLPTAINQLVEGGRDPHATFSALMFNAFQPFGWRKIVTFCKVNFGKSKFLENNFLKKCFFYDVW